MSSQSDAPARTMPRWLAPFSWLTNAMNVIGTLGIFTIMVLICTDVGMRAVLSRPLVGVPEVVKLGIVSIVFLQGAHTLAAGRFTTSGLFLGWLGSKAPRAARTLRSAFSLAGAGLFAVIARGAFDQATWSFETGDFVGSLGIFTIPIWPMHAIILFGSIVLALQFCLQAAIDGLGLVPVDAGVPAPDSADKPGAKTGIASGFGRRA